MVATQRSRTARCNLLGCCLVTLPRSRTKLREDVDFAVGITLKWLRREEKEKEERNKRKAEEHEEEDKKRRATEGYRPAFIIDIDGVPLEEVETARRLATVAAAEDLSQWNGEDNKNNTERSALR